MSDLTLTVKADRFGDTRFYSYGPDRLEMSLGTVDRSVSGLSVELGDIPLSIIPGPGGDSSLVAYDTALDLPEGTTWRAKLEDGQGRVLLDGAVVASDCTYRQKSDQWEVRLIDQAPRDFWTRLEGTYIEKPRLIDSYFVEAHFVYDEYVTGGSVAPQKPREVLTYMFDQANISYDIPDPLWSYEVQYGDHVHIQDSSEVVMTYVEGFTRKKIVETIRDFAGLRVIPRYQAFGDADLHVDFVPTSWPSPSPEVVLDGQEDKEGARHQMESSEGIWALALKNGAEDPSPDPRDQKYTEPEDKTTGTDVPTFATPPPWASVAAQEWQAAPPQGFEGGSFRSGGAAFTDPRQLWVESESTGVRVPPVAPAGELTMNDGAEKLVYGRVRVKWGADVSTPAFMQTVEHDGARWAVYCQRPVSTDASNDFQTLAHAAHWPRGPYQNQAQRRTSWREVEVGILGESSLEPAPGDATTLLDYEGTSWMTWKVSRDIKAGIFDLTLRSPVQPLGTVPSIPVRPSTAGAQIPVRDRSDSGYSYKDMPWEVAVLAAEYRTLERGDGKEDWFLVHWERTATRYCREVYYQVEYRDNDESSPTWTAIGSQLFPKVYSTALTYPIEASGQGGKTPYDGRYEVRVRPVVVAGVTGDWSIVEVNKPESN